MAPAPTLLYKNIAGEIFADPAGYMRSQWSAEPRTLADTQALLNGLSAGMREYGWSRALINQVAMQPFSEAEQQWVVQQWLPQAVREAGYRLGAIVVASNIYSRLAMSYVTTNMLGLPMRYRSFDDEAEAIDWLLKQR
jgi:hypothetical protein